MPELLPETLGFTTRYFDLPGLRLHAAVAGPEDGRLVLLLHGFPSFWYSWRLQIGPLAKAGYRVVAPDQRGFNLTAKAPPYDLATTVDDVRHLITACGCDSACVAGHDTGAGVAWALASAYPESVQRLAILNLPHGEALRALPLRLILRQVLRIWYAFFFQIPYWPEAILAADDYRRLGLLLQRSANPGTFSAEDLERHKESWRQPRAMTAMLGGYRAPLRSARPLDQLAPFTRRIRVPTLILWGERDAALQVELADASTKWLDEGRLIRYPEATHWVHEDLPEEVNRQLLNHFGSTP